MGNQDYSVRQILEMGACTGCRFCVDVCPAVSASGQGELSALYRIRGLSEILKRRTALFRRILRRKAPSEKELKEYSESVFRCTLCGNCQEICPAGIHLKRLWTSIRQDLVHSASYPARIDMIRDNLKKSFNVFAEDNRERADWVEDLRDAPDHGYVREHAEIVYFTGCVSSYFPLAQKIPMALAEIMDLTGVDFTILSEEEWCCGFPLLGAGLKELFKVFVEHNFAAVRARRAKKVIFACPSCFQMWREHYPSEIPIAHASQFLGELVKAGRIPLKELPMKVTYHDPCDLGRGARVFDEPRDLIRSIPGVKLVEMDRNRENCLCCGGGGNLEMIDAKLSSEIAKRKIEEVMGTGSSAVITSCQQCVRTMTTYVKRNKISLEVMDITQLVHRALKR